MVPLISVIVTFNFANFERYSSCSRTTDALTQTQNIYAISE